jgi:hypothetical protein
MPLNRERRVYLLLRRLELPISCSVGRRLIHWATGACAVPGGIEPPTLRLTVVRSTAKLRNLDSNYANGGWKSAAHTKKRALPTELRRRAASRTRTWDPVLKRQFVCCCWCARMARVTRAGGVRVLEYQYGIEFPRISSQGGTPVRLLL